MRLKKLFLIFIFALGVAIFPKGALAQTFLTYEQFQSLKTVHQIEYISDLQKLIVELNANEALASGEELTQAFRFEKLISGFLPEAQAQTSMWEYRNQQCRLKSAARLSKTDLFSNIENVRNCTEISVNGSPKYYLPAVAERLVVLTGEIKTRLQNGKLSRKERRVGEVIGTLQATIQGFNEVGTSDGKNYQAYIRKASQNLASIGAGSKAVAARPVVKAKATASTKPVAAPAAADVTKPASPPAASKPAAGLTAAKPAQSVARAATVPDKEESAPQPAARPATGSESEFPYQCMYAGFVIPKNPKNSCQPFKKLPASFVGDFFNAEQFTCAKADEILCNPLIFGYEPNCGTEVDTSCSAKKPLCTVRAQNATQNCFELSQSKMTRAQVLKIWQSADGKKAYETFIHSLFKLCDPEILKKRNLREAVLNDITQTCSVAFKAMDQNLKDKFLPSLGPLEKRLHESRANSTD